MTRKYTVLAIAAVLLASAPENVKPAGATGPFPNEFAPADQDWLKTFEETRGRTDKG